MKNKLVLFDWGNIVESFTTGYSLVDAFKDLYKSMYLKKAVLMLFYYLTSLNQFLGYDVTITYLTKGDIIYNIVRFKHGIRTLGKILYRDS